MQRISWSSALAAALVFSNTAAHAWSGQVMGSLGYRLLGENDWGQFDQQPAIGIHADFKIGDSPLYATTSLILSADDDDFYTDSAPSYYVEQTVAVADLSVGLKFMPRFGDVSPYIGGGLGSVGVSYATEINGEDDDDSDSSVAGWAAVGIVAHFGQFVAGLDVRRLMGTEFNYGYGTFDADGTTISMMFGWAWGE